MTTLRDAISLFDAYYLTSKSDGHRDHCLGRLGDIRPSKPLRANSLLAFVGDVPIESITVADVQRWANSLVQQDGRYQSKSSTRPCTSGGLSASTVDGYRRVFSSFWKWAVRWPGIPVEANLTTAVAWPAAPKLNELPPKALSDTAVEALFKAPATMRDACLVRLLAFTGMRVHEAAALLLADLHLVERYALLRVAKGNKQRVIIFDDFTAALLAEYIEEYRPVTAVPQVFVTTMGKAQPITAETIRQALGRMAERAGIEEPVSPHRLRHWFATTALAAGGNLAAVQDLMGHSDPSMTRRYSKFNHVQLRQQYDEVFGGAAKAALSSGLFAAPTLLDGRRKRDEDYGRLATRVGFTWLGPLPGSTDAKTHWCCAEGHEWEASYRSLQQGGGCHECANLVRKTPGDFLALGRERGFFWVAGEATNNSTAVTWKCGECGHEWGATFNTIQQGGSCPACDQRHPPLEAEFFGLAARHDIEWAGEGVPANRQEKTRWRDKGGREWLASFESIDKRTTLTDGVQNARRPSMAYRELARDKGGEWLGDVVPPNNRVKTSWGCARCGETFEANYNRVQQGTCLCRPCALGESGRRAAGTKREKQLIESG